MSTILIRPTGDSWTLDACYVDFAETVSITDHPIESGAIVSDHAQRQPSLITLTATISESPWSDKTNGVLVQRRADFLLFLEAAVGESLVLSTEQYGTFHGYMLADWRHGLDGTNSAKVNVTLKQVKIAEAGYVTIPVSAPKSSASAGFASGQSVGEQATTTASGAGVTADSSALYSMFYGG